MVSHRSPNPVTTALINALNDMFDTAASQRFAYQSGVPTDLVLALYLAALLTIGALGYQFGVAGHRQEILSLLLLFMWTGGILLIVALSKPRMGDIGVEAEPLEIEPARFAPAAEHVHRGRNRLGEVATHPGLERALAGETERDLAQLGPPIVHRISALPHVRPAPIPVMSTSLPG